MIQRHLTVEEQNRFKLFLEVFLSHVISGSESLTLSVIFHVATRLKTGRPFLPCKPLKRKSDSNCAKHLFRENRKKKNYTLPTKKKKENKKQEKLDKTWQIMFYTCWCSFVVVFFYFICLSQIYHSASMETIRFHWQALSPHGVGSYSSIVDEDFFSFLTSYRGGWGNFRWVSGRNCQQPSKHSVHLPIFQVLPSTFSVCHWLLISHSWKRSSQGKKSSLLLSLLEKNKNNSFVWIPSRSWNVFHIKVRIVRTVSDLWPPYHETYVLVQERSVTHYVTGEL